MILATRKNNGRDGELLVVEPGHRNASVAAPIASHLQAALDHWDAALPRLESIRNNSFPLDTSALVAPLPRSYAWLDGSAYLSHVVLARKSRGAELPSDLTRVPLMYQGGSDSFLGPTAPLVLADESFGMDLEAELAVITTDVPMGVSSDQALSHIALVTLCNDVTLRSLVPGELTRGFGFLQSKPPTAFAPFAVTVDELGKDWRQGRAFLKMEVSVNDRRIGSIDTGREMHFSFGDLIAHAAKTRPLSAGTVIGSGTVSSESVESGAACLAEIRMRETLEFGRSETSFLRHGDRVRIEAFSSDGKSVFGALEQQVVGISEGKS